MEEVVRGNSFLHNGQPKAAKYIHEYLVSNSLKIYEVFRVFGTKPIFLNDHIERLEASIIKLGKKVPLFLKSDILKGIKIICEINQIKEGNIKILIQFFEYDIDLFIYNIPHAYPNESMYKIGVDVGLYEFERENPNIKKLSDAREAMNNYIAKHNLYEVLLVDSNGRITEGSRTNVFFIDPSNKIYTSPDESVLKGVTRKYILNLIKINGFDIKLDNICEINIHKYKAAFLTGTSPKILPIKKIENITFDVDSRLMRRIMKKYNNLIAEEIK